MKVLRDTGNEFRRIDFKEYKCNRKKSGFRVRRYEERYFDTVVKFTVSEDAARKFSPFWWAV